MSSEGFFLFILFYLIYELNKSNIKERNSMLINQTVIYAGPPMNIKSSISNLQYLSHFFFDFIQQKQAEVL